MSLLSSTAATPGFPFVAVLDERGAPTCGEIGHLAVIQFEMFDGATEGKPGVAAVEDSKLIHINSGRIAGDNFVWSAEHAGQVRAHTVAAAADFRVVPGDHDIRVHVRELAVDVALVHGVNQAVP